MRTLVTAATAAALIAGLLAVGEGTADASVTACTGSAITTGHNAPQGAAGHGNVILRFRNTSTHTCSLHGYPGADALGPYGGVLAHAKRTLHGFTGGANTVPTVVLAPNGLASADLEWANLSSGGGTCSFSKSIAATPANTAKTAKFAISVSTCDLQIHPTVAGGTGNG